MIRKSAAAVAAVLLLAGCGSQPSAGPIVTPSATSASPTPSASVSAVVSRESRLAVRRCGEALLWASTPLAGYVRAGDPQEDAEDALDDVDSACGEAMTQLGADGATGPAAEMSDIQLRVSGIRLAVSMGSTDELEDGIDYLDIFGEAQQQIDSIEIAIGTRTAKPSAS